MYKFQKQYSAPLYFIEGHHLITLLWDGNRDSFSGTSLLLPVWRGGTSLVTGGSRPRLGAWHKLLGCRCLLYKVRYWPMCSAVQIGVRAARLSAPLTRFCPALPSFHILVEQDAGNQKWNLILKAPKSKSGYVFFLFWGRKCSRWSLVRTFNLQNAERFQAKWKLFYPHD